MTEPAVLAEGLVKRFGEVVALDGLDLSVEEGSVCGLLGPNGAGKTTAVRILATLLRPDAGVARVAGFDVVSRANEVKKIIGLTGQYAAVDEYLTGRENINMVGRLYHLDHKWVDRRADELLERFRLTDAADRPAKTYSGGMRRRLDLAASLVARPKILFLDEPTTGLDPRSRVELWEVIEQLVRDGTTVLLTTQYLEEADYLAEKIVVIDQGRVIASGDSEALKDQVGGDLIEVVVGDGGRLAEAAGRLAPLGQGAPVVDEVARKITMPVSGGSRILIETIRVLDSEGIELDDLVLRRPTLDDVFLALTGRGIEEESGSGSSANRSGGRGSDGRGSGGRRSGGRRSVERGSSAEGSGK